VSSVQCPVTSVQCPVSSVQCPVSTVQCAASPGWPAAGESLGGTCPDRTLQIPGDRRGEERIGDYFAVNTDSSLFTCGQLELRQDLSPICGGPGRIPAGPRGGYCLRQRYTLCKLYTLYSIHCIAYTYTLYCIHCIQGKRRDKELKEDGQPVKGSTVMQRGPARGL
jgi:hypothetical protein